MNLAGFIKVFNNPLHARELCTLKFKYRRDSVKLIRAKGGILSTVDFCPMQRACLNSEESIRR